MARVEREASLQNENCNIKIRTIELEANNLREENQRLRIQCDKQAADLHMTEEKLEITQDNCVHAEEELATALGREKQFESERLASEELMIELGREVERLRAEKGPAMPTTSPETIRLEELHQEMQDLRDQKKGNIYLGMSKVVFFKLLFISSIGRAKRGTASNRFKSWRRGGAKPVELHFK